MPRSQSGGRWPGVGSTLQFAELLHEVVPRLDPARYVTNGSHDTFELIVRAKGGSPTSSFLLCSLFSDPLGLRSQTCLDFPRSKAAVSPYRAATVCCLQLSRSDRRTSCFGYLTAGSTLDRTSRSTWWASILVGATERRSGVRERPAGKGSNRAWRYC